MEISPSVKGRRMMPPETTALLQAVCSGRLSGGNPALLKGKTMEIDLIFKIAGTGSIVAVLNLVLKRAEREEQAMMTTLAGLVVVLMLLV